MPLLKQFFACTLSSVFIFSAAAQKPVLPQPTERQTYKSIDETKLEVCIYKPTEWKASDKRSAIVFYHGGGWSGGSPSAFARQCEKLAARGMVAMSVQYRLISQPGVRLADCVKDARSAFRWVTSHADSLGIDPGKIAAGGGSAGGHLAATLVTLDQINESTDDLQTPIHPAALLLFNPAVKLDFPKVREKRSEGEYAQILQLSPYHSLKRGHPPTLILHGSADSTVPLTSVQEYATKVRELGGSCEVSVFEGREHSFFNKEPDIWDSLNQGIAFLQSLGL